MVEKRRSGDVVGAHEYVPNAIVVRREPDTRREVHACDVAAVVIFLATSYTCVCVFS